MLCDECKKAEATVHLTHVEDAQVVKLHLCQACAIARGVDTENASLAELLLGFGAAATAGAAAQSKNCPRCHWSRTDFKKTGLLGCPLCYSAFESELTPMLRSMHRHLQHAGRIPPQGGGSPADGEPAGGAAPRPSKKTASAPPSPPSAPDPAILIIEEARIEKAMENAVAAEAFEEAARLRDQLAEIRNQLKRATFPSAPPPQEGAP